MSSTCSISGAKVILRDWIVEDLDAFARWNAAGEAWQRLDGPYYSRPDRAELASLVHKLGERIRDATWPTPRERLAIADKETHALLGGVSRYWQSRETNWLSLGIVIYDPASWRRGLGYEALGLWCEYLWRSLPELVRLDVRTWSGNPGMMSLARKLGFREEARFRDARVVDGTFYDGMGYGILRREWAERFPGGFPGDFGA